MFVSPPSSIRAAIAVGLLLAAAPAPAEEGLSEHWFEQRELEMTRSLTVKIEDEALASVTRKVELRLARADTLRGRSATPSPAAPAASDSSAAERSRMSCSTPLGRSFTCVIRPEY